MTRNTHFWVSAKGVLKGKWGHWLALLVVGANMYRILHDPARHFTSELPLQTAPASRDAVASAPQGAFVSQPLIPALGWGRDSLYLPWPHPNST